VELSGDARTLAEDATAGRREAADVSTLRELMWECVGIVRDGERLEGAARNLALWEAASGAPYDRRSHELANMVVVGRLMAEAALLREESRGAHFRTDFPSAREEWRRHIVFRKD
jgi:L-aspartate oxidase